MARPDNNPQASRKKPQKQFNSFLKYSGLAMQMALTIGVATWLGYWIDQRLGFEFPLFMLLLMLVSLGGILYRLIKNIQDES